MPSGFISRRFFIMAQTKRYPAVFLDRDGTLIEDMGYIDVPDKIQVIDGAIKAVKFLNKMGFKTIIVSNQSGVARGYFNEDTVKLINDKVIGLFKQQEAIIDAVYYCPHHPKYGNQIYKKDCECRKPKPGMILKAVDEYKIDLSKSIFIGDKYTDVLTGKNLHLFSILVLTGFGKKENEIIKSDDLIPKPDLITEDILQAVSYIKSEFLKYHG